MILPLVDIQTSEIFQLNIVPLDTTVHYYYNYVTITTGFYCTCMASDIHSTYSMGSS